MNYGKAVEEIWTWRETFEKELRHIPRDQQVRYLNETAKKTCKKLGIKCRRPKARIKVHA
ncbi:MAG: hypothetical protein PHC61_14775 [Chitinivibrionales bacterium]|nr:hypothetical protein [Chitinivibrionales bacterium]